MEIIDIHYSEHSVSNICSNFDLLFQASLIVDMPLSRTRSLLANINTSASATVSASATSDNSSGYSSHFSDTQEHVQQ